MEFKFNKPAVTIYLNHHIDATNAADTDKEFSDIIEQYKPQCIILDAKDMEYISSAGLRVLLKLKKSVEQTEIINTSLAVYDILEMTGITNIISVRRILKTVSVEGCKIIGKGGHGTVYRLNDDTIVKVYNAGEPFAEIEREISYAKNAFVHGIPTAISFDIVRCDDRYGVVFELLNASTLADTFKSEEEAFDEYAAKYQKLILDLHKTEADTETFSNIKELYHQWTDDMKNDYTPEQITMIHNIIDSVPDRSTFVHGDIHPKNIMVQDGELLFIDMADMSYGHPIWDYAGMALTHILSGSYTEGVIGIPGDKAQKLFDMIIKTNFSDKSAEEQAHIHQVIMMYGLLKFALAPAVNKGEHQDVRNLVLAAARERFFPIAEQLIGAVDF